jgi:N-methylhydantoinase A
LREAYQARYEEQFGLRIAGVPLEFLTWSVTVSTSMAEAMVPPAPGAGAAAEACGTRSVFDPASGKTAALPVYWRAELPAGMRLEGPALVMEPQTTTLLPEGWNLQVTSAGHLLLARP